MRPYTKYSIKDTDVFDSGNYPQLYTDLTRIKEGTAHTPDAFKADILISFTKNHSLKMEWLNANPEFAELVTSGALPIRHMEALFEASHRNSFFRNGFEEYVKNMIH